jgi:FkbM family methyltransferase
MKTKIDKKTGLNYRPGTLDEYVIKEQSCYNELFERAKGKIVLDMGGNIGSFAFNAIQHGAKKVASFEPEPDNIKMFESQELGKESTLFPYAVTDKDGTAEFFVNSKLNKGTHTLRKTRGRDTITVETKAFKKVLKTVKPDIMKVDIEGGEYFIDFTLIPDSVKAIAVELHLNGKGERAKGKKLLKWLQENFDQINNAKIGDKNWTTLFIGVRE